MDWIMAPSIAAYNHFVRTNTGRSLDDVLKTYAPGITTKADMEKFYQIMNLIINCSALGEKNTGWSYSHDDIINFLQLKEGQKIHLFNVDHHHDLGYEDNANSPYYRVNCANWVSDLNRNNHLASYCWVNNETSQNPDEEQIQVLPEYLTSKDIYILKRIPFDKVFIATSPDWIPGDYHPLLWTATKTLSRLSDAPVDEI